MLVVGRTEKSIVGITLMMGEVLVVAGVVLSVVEMYVGVSIVVRMVIGVVDGRDTRGGEIGDRH